MPRYAITIKPFDTEFAYALNHIEALRGTLSMFVHQGKLSDKPYIVEDTEFEKGFDACVCGKKSKRYFYIKERD